MFVVGASNLSWSAIHDFLGFKGIAWNTQPAGASNPEGIAEAAGRVCYQSWANKKGSTRSEYLQRSIIEHGHGSVLEHVWFNCLVVDLPRSVQLELVRHGEGTAFSFESQRFTDSDLRFVAPPAIRGNHAAMMEFSDQCLASRGTYQILVDQLRESIAQDGLYEGDATLQRKRVKEAARAVLPNATASDGMFSLNARAARHIVELRSDEHADASIREFSFALYEALVPMLPSVFADAELVPVTFGPPAVKFKAKKV